jgi:hypothetical protein
MQAAGKRTANMAILFSEKTPTYAQGPLKEVVASARMIGKTRSEGMENMPLFLLVIRPSPKGSR